MILTPKARILNDWDVLEDMEACRFAVENGGDLVCIVNSDDWSMTLYDDGEFAADRKFCYTLMFPNENAARECIGKLSPFFHASNGSTISPMVVSVVDAATARLATYEAKNHEWGE